MEVAAGRKQAARTERQRASRKAGKAKAAECPPLQQSAPAEKGPAQTRKRVDALNRAVEKSLAKLVALWQTQ